jgi:3-hydroxybutyryl-CoA dehydrogenase
MLQAMVARGQTGLNAGKGFYDWAGADPERERVRVSHALTALLAFLDTLDSEVGSGAARSTSTPRGA